MNQESNYVKYLPTRECVLVKLTINSPAGGALLVCISIEADPDPSVLSATTINLYLAPGSNPIDNQFEHLVRISMKLNIKLRVKLNLSINYP